MSYKPYMFGGSKGGYSNSATSFNQQQGQQQQQRMRGPHESVRDCMYWPLSLGASAPATSSRSPAQAQGDYQVAGWSNVGGSPGYNAAPKASVSSNENGGTTVTFEHEPMTQQQKQSIPVNYPQAKAFMQGGQGELHPLSIPCQLAPSGAPIQPLSSLQPMTLKVTAPAGAARNGQPMTFQINPYAGLQQAPTRRH